MTRSGPSRAALALLVAASLGYLAMMFVWFTLPAFLAPIIEEFGLSNAQAGLLAGAVPLMYIPLGLLSGVLIDRVGSRWGVGVGLAIIGVAQLVRSTSTGFLPMLAATLLLGVGGTGITFGLPKLVSDLFEPERVGSISSVYIVGSYLGIAAAFSVGRSILGPLLGGWRPVFLLTGALTVGLALVWLLLVQLLDHDDRTVGDASEALTVATLRRDAVRVVGNRNVRLLVLIGTMYLLLLHGLQGWVAAVLEFRGVAATTAAAVASVFVVAQIGGAVTLPVVADRWRRRRAVVALGGVLSSLGVFGLLLVDSPLTAGVAVVTVGLGLGGLSPLIRSLPVEMDGVGPGLTATAVGLVFAVGEIGGFGGPFVIGVLRDATGSFVPGLAVLVVAGLVVVVAAIGLEGIDDPPERPRVDDRAAGGGAGDVD